MRPDHVDFADWDAAFVLGALSPADRRRFETHMEECRACRTAITELAPTIGLLARVAPERASSMLEPPAAEGGPDPARRAQVIAIGERAARIRRTRWWAAGLASAAAVVIAVTIAVTTVIAPALKSVEVVALEPVADVPWTATVELSDAAWGTRIEMICRYTGEADGDTPGGGWPYVLVVTSVDGTTSELSTWRALPGSTARLDAATALDADDIATIEIRAVADDRVLMRGELADR